MSATTRRGQPVVVHETTAPAPSLLNDIIDRMSVIEAKQARPAPVKLATWEDIERFAEKAARSGMVPPAYNGKPDAIVIAIQMGSELGLAPMQSLQNIAIINGRPAVWGDALPGLCRASGLMRTMREWCEGEGDSLTYYCEATRKDDPQPIKGEFSVTDARKAQLLDKAGPWKQYPKRMLQMRARGFCLRDAFPDVLKGLVTAEEAEDAPSEETFVPAQRVVRQKTPEEKYPTLFGVADGSAWLNNLSAVLAASRSETMVNEVEALDPVTASLASAPLAVKRQIAAMFSGARERLKAAPTNDTFIAALRAELETPLTAEEIDAILARDDVQRAQDTFKGTDKADLDKVVTAAVARAQDLETTAPNDVDP